MPIETLYCGYIISRASLSKYAKRKQIPLDKSDPLPHEERIHDACDMLIDEAPDARAETVGVYTKSGKSCLCIALASNDTEDWLPMQPRPEDVASFKRLLKIEIEPCWFRGW